MTERILVACYGSLKKGFYNHVMLGENAKFLGHDSVRGVMYLCGSYPRLYEEVNDDYDKPGRMGLARSYEIEIYEIDCDKYLDIRDMELGSGYSEEGIQTKHGEAKIYWARPQYHREHHKYITEYTK